MWRAVFASLLCLVLCPSAPQAQTVDAELTLDDARALAIFALQNGDPALAIRIGKGLLQANPKDADAFFILTSGYAQLGDTRASRKAAARAYRVSETRPDRLRAAELAAKAALADKRLTLTQIWLRRASINTDDAQSETLIARDYRHVRAMNPWSFRLRTGLRPSDNVNNGARSAVRVIDGVPELDGETSADGQALSGVIGTTDLSLRYRLSQTDRARTTIGTRLYFSQVALSSEAKAALAADGRDIDNSDFSSTVAEVSLNRDQFWGRPGATLGYGLALGSVWYGGESFFDYARVSARRRLPIADVTTLGLDTSFEFRDSAIRDSRDQTRASVGANLHHKLEGGDSVSLSVSLQDVNADEDNSSYRAAQLSGTYAFGRQMGPALVSASLNLGIRDYPRYLSVGADGIVIDVPGGRQDTSIYGDLNFFMTDFDYAGFAPSIRLRAGRQDSNDSRFDTEELSISFEIQSKF